jgi:hypothetical protein
LKTLKPELKTLGFIYRDGMFQWSKTLDEPLHFSIVLQKNVHGDTYKIILHILIRSPLIDGQDRRPLLSAHLLPGRIRFHAPREIWWSADRLVDAVTALRRDSLPWFQKWRSPNMLLEKIEESIEQRKSLIEVVEPLNREEEDALHRVWPGMGEETPAVPVVAYFAASVLYYLVGNREMSIQRTNDWLRRLSFNDAQERSEALAQLKTLEQKSQ